MNARLSALMGAVVAAGVLGTAATASAGQIDLGGYTGPVVIKFSNFESFTGSSVTTGAQNFGIFNITSIQDTTGDTLWFSGKNGQYLDGVFNGITVASVTPAGGGQFNALGTGGTFNIYLNTSSFAGVAAQGTSGYIGGVGSLGYNGISNVGGQLALTANLVPGVSAVDPTATLASTINGQTLPVTGTAQGDLQITGGTDASQFLTDLFLQDDFCPNVAGSACNNGGGLVGDWQLLSNDPLRGNVVPEPNTLAVVGSALLGFGLFGWRRRRS